jgi:hypothetical protein
MEVGDESSSSNNSNSSSSSSRQRSKKKRRPGPSRWQQLKRKKRGMTLSWG